MTNRKHVIVFLALALVLLVSACGSPGSTGSQAPLQVLQKSLTAMQQLKAVHISTKLTSNGDWGRSSKSSTAQPFSVSATANGDEVRPDESMLHLSIGQGYNVAEIKLGKQLYVQNSKGQWYVLDTSKYKGSANNPFTEIGLGSPVSQRPGRNSPPPQRHSVCLHVLNLCAMLAVLRHFLPVGSTGLHL